MKRLLVTGASGLLGINLALRESAHREVTGITNSHNLSGVPFPVEALDLTLPGMVKRVLAEKKLDVVVNCAALANIDDCEKEPAKAALINSTMPGWLAQECHTRGIRLVHLSTDAVFDGLRGGYRETDKPHPLSVYAQTKLDGEKAVLDACPEAVIARVNFYGWSLSGKRSLAEFFYNNLSAGKQVNGFTDVLFCPLFVDHLVDVLMRLADSDHSGLFHVVSPVALSKFDFGCKIARALKLDDRLIKPVSVEDGGLLARRSPNLTLNMDKLRNALQLALPGVDEGIQAFASQLADGYPQRIRKFLAQ